MALTFIERIGPLIIRAGAVGACGLAVITVFILADIWRIERRLGRPITCVAVAFLATGVILCALIFGWCAIIGQCLPRPPQERCQ